MTAASARNDPRLIANIGALDRFRDRVGVWLSFAGAAYYRAYSAQLGRLGLKPSWITALAIVQQNPGIAQSELGRFMAVNRASAMALAVEMEDAGLLQRRLLAGRNKTALSITDRGSEALDQGCRVDEVLSQVVLADFSDAQRERLVRQLERIEQALHKPLPNIQAQD